MTETTPKSVFINGDKDKFLSKGAVNRFKTDLKKCDPKDISIEDGKYLKQGFVFKVTHKDNRFDANIITLEEHMKEERRRMLKNKIKRMDYHRSKQAKQDRESLKRSIPDKLFKSYMNLLKQGNFSNIPSPKDVIENPERFQRQISMIMGKDGMVSNDNNANNAIKKYFNSLGSFMGIEPAQMRVNNTQSVQQNVNNASLVEEVDTEDEDDAPNLVSV